MNKELNFRVNKDGKKIYQFDCVIDCRALETSYERPETNEELNKRIQEKIEKEGETDLSVSAGPSPPSVPEDEKVRVVWRLVSGKLLWPSSRLPYPQCVDLGHDNSAVIASDIAPLINAFKPDIMWNHSALTPRILRGTLRILCLRPQKGNWKPE